MISILKTNTII